MTDSRFPIRAVFFDIGDTLVFDNPSQVSRIHIAAASCGLELDRERMDPAFRQVEDYALARYVLGEGQDHPDVARRCVDILWERFGLEALGDDHWRDLQQAYAAVPFVRELHPGALDLLGGLKADGFTLGVVSDWDLGLEALLMEMGVRPFLDALAVSDIVGCTKPDPRIFESALAQAGAAPGETIHIGDFYELDVAGARAAGMRAALFDWRGRKPEADCPSFATFDGMAAFLNGLPRFERAS